MTPEERAQAILDRAGSVLAKVDRAHIFSVNECRQFPTFESTEIDLGPPLGKGGFSNVSEIFEFHLTGAAPESDKNEQAISERDSSAQKYLNRNKKITGDDDHDKKMHNIHYDVKSARDFMSEHASRFGSARYAIKQLRDDLDAVDRARGALDLAIEIKYLSAIWHPNIIKMRGYSPTPRVDVNTFIILDRLYGTLDDKIEQWEHLTAMAKGCCGLSEKSPQMVEVLKDRLLVAYDLSSAFNYLHDVQLLYRDLKPENVGFDVRGDVKLFDFGLCKSLESTDKVANGYGYNLTAKTGSIPYMAPEIALGKPYGKEADVYSFSVLLWELMSLEWAFNGFSAREYFTHVCAQEHRLSIRRTWPAVIRTLIREGWDANPQRRPNMKRVGALIRGHLEDISSEAAVLKRTQYLMNRSRRSMHEMLDSGRKWRRADSLSSSKGGSIRSSKSGREMFVDGDACGSEVFTTTQEAPEVIDMMSKKKS